ncbi:MAG: hypothetical protein ABIP75_12535 [Pyrinomonadaceae bacterium]
MQNEPNENDKPAESSDSPDPGSEQFKYDTPYDGGSASDRAGIKAAKEGKLITDVEEVEQAKEEVKEERGE